MIPIAELRVFLWWATHFGVSAAGVAVGRLLLLPADGLLVAQSPVAPLGWWVRSLALLFVLAMIWLLFAWIGLGFDPTDSAARLFFGMAVLVALAAFAAGAVAPSRPVSAITVGVALWFVFYLFAEGAPNAATTAGGQGAFALWVIAVSLGVSYFALSRLLGR
jgi:hypothetical protein